MASVKVAVLVTLDSKAAEGRFFCASQKHAGAEPWVVDLSCRPHEEAGADVSGREVAERAGRAWEALLEMDRGQAADVMTAGGIFLLREAVVEKKDVFGVIGIGGANGSSMACGIMRALPPLFPKVMVSAVAATGAVQWYVGASDIVMFPSIGDLSLNRITGAVMENAARAVSAMAEGWAGRPADQKSPPLVGVSSFGGTMGCVGRVESRLWEAGYETILFHASGPGGRALESLAGLGELAGVVDITTSELTDVLVDGVYSAGEARLTSAGERGLPQVVVPGALDHANFLVGDVPERYAAREFFQYNAQNMLMRTNAEEYEALGRMFAERLNRAAGPVAVLIPKKGFSEHTKRATHDLGGREIGRWDQPGTDAAFVRSLRAYLKKGKMEELDLHINDPAFADACADAFLEMAHARNTG